MSEIPIHRSTMGGLNNLGVSVSKPYFHSWGICLKNVFPPKLATNHDNGSIKYHKVGSGEEIPGSETFNRLALVESYNKKKYILSLDTPLSLISIKLHRISFKLPSKGKVINKIFARKEKSIIHDANLIKTFGEVYSYK